MNVEIGIDGIQLMDQDDIDVSTMAGHIVTNAMHIPRSLFCPYCADEYMFEFTLKDHLKKVHSKVLLQRAQQQNDNDLLLDQSYKEIFSYDCPYCGALFYYNSLLPKHIASHHGDNVLRQWRLEENAMKQYNENKENEPSVVLASCSPGLSDIFDKLRTVENTDDFLLSQTNDEKPVKSILKKTPNTPHKIILSPSSVSFHRTKIQAIKRSNSVRRELRFDVPYNGKTISPKDLNQRRDPNQKSNGRVTKRHISKIKNIFRLSKRTSKIQTKSQSRLSMKRSQSISPKSKSKMITSTPIFFLDDSQTDIRSESNIPKWEAPKFYNLDRYQCARCKLAWSTNTELLAHLEEHHKSAKNFFRPHYRCGECGATFYKNSYLVRHCNTQHLFSSDKLSEL